MIALASRKTRTRTERGKPPGSVLSRSPSLCKMSKSRMCAKFGPSHRQGDFSSARRVPSWQIRGRRSPEKEML